MVFSFGAISALSATLEGISAFLSSPISFNTSPGVTETAEPSLRYLGTDWPSNGSGGHAPPT